MDRLMIPVALIAIAGCAISPEPCESPEADGNEVADEFAVGGGGRGVSRAYGVWVGKGPKILAEDGSPLTKARVMFSNDLTSEGLSVDETGRVTVNRYIPDRHSRSYTRNAADGDTLTITCPGYHPAVNVPLLGGDGAVKEIRLKPLLGQPPCRSFSSVATVLRGKGDRCCGFDLVEGDWLPPYGWGKVEDIRVTLSTNMMSGSAAYSVSYKGVKRVESRGDGPVMRVEFVRDGDGFGKDTEGYLDCTTRVALCRQYDHGLCGVFKVRGCYGSIDSSALRSERLYYYAEDEGGSGRRDVADVYKVVFSGRVNAVAGLKALEAASGPVAPRPPVSHPAPNGADCLAFGVSENGRAAVCFGWTKAGAVVPEIFRRGVYTTDPAKDIPGLETLYVDTNFRVSNARPIVNGMKKLRTVVWSSDYSANTIGERFCADNPKLDAVIIDGYRPEVMVAADAFAGASTNLTAVYASYDGYSTRPWDCVAVSNVFSRMVRIYSASDLGGGKMLAPPEVDLARGEIELPVITLEDGYLDKEYSDGRVLRYRNDGFIEKLYR